MTTRSLLGSLLMLALLLPGLGLLAGCEQEPPKPKLTGNAESRMPAFSFANLAGEQQASSQWNGKVLVINYWATWCPPCRKEIPHLKKAYDSLHDKGLEIVGISLDDGRVELDAVKAFTSKHEMKWPQVYGDASRTIAEAYMVEYIPTTYLIDGDTGKVLGTKENLRGEELEATIKKHMDEKAKAAKSDKGKGQKSRP
jgi:peroxiredoxin